MKRKQIRQVKVIAKEQIFELFHLAEKVFQKDKKLANSYVYLARRIAMKANIRIPRNLKRRYCKHCYTYLVPGTNCRVRMTKSRVVYYCSKCNKYMRFHIK